MSENNSFTATLMPDKDWWQSLWPNPHAVLKAVGIKPDMEVVDLCCGDGHFTQPMCELVYPGMVWALDLDADLLAGAEKACKNSPNFHSILGDARDLANQIPEPVDFVFIANTFHGVPDKKELSETVYDSLKPKGYFAIINWHNLPRETTTVLGQSRGPDTVLRMKPDEVKTYVKPAGFELKTVIDVGPYHYAAIFIKRDK